MVFFDINYKGGITLNSVANYKKLLSLLSRVELTSGFSDFLGRLRVQQHAQGPKVSTISSLTPPKAVMMQLYLNEQVFQNQSDMEYVRDVVLQ